MGIVDLVIILVIAYGIYSGWQSGAIKMISTFIIIFITTLIAGKLSDVLFELLYNTLPFFNLYGKTEGLKSLNIIIWKMVLYVLVFIIIFVIIRKLLIRFKIEEKISDSMVNANFLSKIFGAILSVPLMFTIIFNVILILLIPCFNFKLLNNSNTSNIIMTKFPILSKANGNLYDNQIYIINRINKKDNTYSNYKKVNNDIIKNMTNTKLVSKSIIDDLEKKDKLLGTRKKKGAIVSSNENIDETTTSKEIEEK